MFFGILLTSPKPPLNFRKLRRVSEEKKSSRCPTCISEQRKHWTRGQEAKYGLIEKNLWEDDSQSSKFALGRDCYKGPDTSFIIAHTVENTEPWI